MPSFAFILGKNPALSAAEIAEVLHQASVGFRVVEREEGWLIIESPSLPHGLAGRLGGTLKVAEVLFSCPALEPEGVREALERAGIEPLLRLLPSRAVFGVSSYRSREEQRVLSEALKGSLKKAGVGAGFLRPAQGIVPHGEVIKKRLLERSFELVVCGKGKSFVCRTLGVHNPYQFKKRDVKRPAQRPMFSMPPRLARIMVNLAGKGGRLADPFCGLGTILQEALLLGWDVWGCDTDPACVEGCRKNLGWLAREDAPDLAKAIRVGDARALTAHIPRGSLDAVVTEPYLGPALKAQPSEAEAGKILGMVSTLR